MSGRTDEAKSSDTLDAAGRILRSAGLHAAVERAGREGEIAAVRAPAEELPAIARLAPRLRSLGFLYVALELGRADPNQGSI